MMTIADQTHSDAVLEVRIVKVKATVRSGIASWDDMTEPVCPGKPAASTPWEGLGKGWVYAATADMNLWSQTGKLLWKKRRGFAALGVQSGIELKYHERPLSEVYDDSGEMQRWLEESFGPDRASHQGGPRWKHPRFHLNSSSNSKKPNRPAKNRSRDHYLASRQLSDLKYLIAGTERALSRVAVKLEHCCLRF